MDQRTYENYRMILKEEMIPAMGCTEPIALAYGAAKAREILGREPERHLKHNGQLPPGWQLTQCLFGEHLLSEPGSRGRTIALVESEKTAVIASGIMPKYIWLATGGKSQLSPEKLSVLRGRKVIAFPDADGYRQWSEKLAAIEGLTITVSDVLEKNATDRDRRDHIDIADWLIRWRQDCISRTASGGPIPAATTGALQEHWSALDLLISELDLIPTAIRHADPI